MSPSDKARYKKLLSAYEALNPLQQAVVQLLSIIYHSVNKSTLLGCLRGCGIQASKNRAFAPRDLTPLLRELKDNRLIVQQNNELHCHALIAEAATRRALQEGRFEAMVEAVQRNVYGWGSSYYYFSSYGHGLRELRIALYQEDFAKANTIMSACVRLFPREFVQLHPYRLIYANPLDALWLQRLPEAMLGEVLVVILHDAMRSLDTEAEALALAEEVFAKGQSVEVLRYVLAEQWLLRGQIAKVRALVQREDNVDTLALRGWLAFLDGANEEAIAHYEAALKLLKKTTRKRKIFFRNLSGIFFIMALLRSGESARLEQALDYIDILENTLNDPFAAICWYFRRIIMVQQGQVDVSENGQNVLSESGPAQNMDRFFYLMSLFWLGSSATDSMRTSAQVLLKHTETSGYRWLAEELAELLCQLGEQSYGERAQQFRLENGYGRSIVQLFRRRQPWEHKLNALLGLTQSATDKPVAQFRLVWWLRWSDGYCTIIPREQKRSAKGVWSKGRAVALKRLYNEPEQLDFLTPQDLRICAAIQSVYLNRYSYYGKSGYEFDNDKALLAMVGHPLVFWEEAPEVRVELVKGEPELLVTQKRAKLCIELSPKLAKDQSLLVVKETPTRLKLIELTPEQQAIVDILNDGLQVPTTAKEQVLEVIAALSGKVTVQSSIGGGAENLEEVKADSRPHIHLLPFGAGLKLEILVRPFADAGPYYRPGAGGKTMIAEIEGRRQQARRDLNEERKQAEQVVAGVPTLTRLGVENWEWTLEEPEDCLEALLELQTLGDQVLLEWPEGESLKVTPPASLQQFRLHIRRQRDWFSATGELRLDDGQMLDMRQLLALMQESPGRFVPLGEGKFLALTREFRKRLEELNSFTEPTAKGVRFHPLAALALEELTEQAGSLRSDRNWKEHIQRLREAETLDPVLPSTLQAELRDYQVEGFRWLARLAHWGVGACLADDMGLGKTVQALALILDRAQQGPALVIAPTSVCMNWLSEASRFTPTLKPVAFTGGNRQELLAGLGPFDVLVCSYTLLQHEIEHLSELVLANHRLG